MTGSTALDVVIGLVFIYSLYSLLTTTITELISSMIRLRPAFLAKGIKRMLDDGSGTEIFSSAFFKQPLIKYLGSKDGVKPSYMAARNFSKALMEVLKESGTSVLGENGQNATEVEKIKAVLSGPTQLLGTSETIRFIRSLLDDAQNDLDKFKIYLEQWYDDTMERVSTWYKRRLQIITFTIGLLVAVGFNVDTIEIVHRLSVDPVVRSKMVAMAEEYVNSDQVKMMIENARDTTQQNDNSPKSDTALLNAMNENLEQLKMLHAASVEANAVLSIEYPVNKDGCIDTARLFQSLLGCLITAFALALGSPFWFDLLNKLIKLRTGTKATAEKEDRTANAVAGQPQGLTSDKREG